MQRFLNRRLLAGFLWVATLAMAVGADGALAVTRMPSFQLAAVSGDRLDSTGLAGQVLLINFFATWCPPCRQEIPSLVKMQEQFADRGFSVIGLSLDQTGEGTVRSFVDKMKINYPVAMGTSEVARGFGGLIGIPTSYLVDRQGNIIKTYPGYTDKKVFEEDIKAAL